MKHLFFLILTLIVAGGQLSAQGGKIYFADGKTLNFSEINYIQGKLTEQGTLVYTASAKDGKMRINYENSVREVPFEKIKLIEISSWKPNCPTCNDLYDVNLNIQTKTGVTINNTNHLLLEYVVVFIDDVLTGEQVSQKVYFGSNGRKNISKIEIY